MSRRHHGRPHHDAHGPTGGGRRIARVGPVPLGGPVADNTRTAAGPAPSSIGHPEPGMRAPGQPQAQPDPSRSLPERPDPGFSPPIDARPSTNSVPPTGVPPTSVPPTNGISTTNGIPTANGAEHPAAFVPADRSHGPGPLTQAVGPRPAGQPGGPGPDRNGQCTAPQLRRFIKSRPYVPMHELRRRFGIDGADDDVTPVRLDPGWVYVGLPTHEGSLLGDLLRNGEIGYELSLDPRTPIVIGVYPMRPIPRS